MNNYLNKDNCVFIILDCQKGLINSVKSTCATMLKSNLINLTAIAEENNIPLIVTANDCNGKNATILEGLKKTIKNGKIINRSDINLWDNMEFKRLLSTKKRKKLIFAGISTDITLANAAISAKKDGYNVYCITDCSASWTEFLHKTAINKLIREGIKLTTLATLTAEIQGVFHKKESLLSY